MRIRGLIYDVPYLTFLDGPREIESEVVRNTNILDVLSINA